MRLLVAEDDRDLAEVLGVFLERNNFAVEVVGDGRTALDHGLSGARCCGASATPVWTHR